VTPVVWNLALAIAWLIVTGTFTEVNFLFGILVGYGILAIASRQIEGGSTYVRKVPKIISFVAFFIVDLVIANLRVAYDVITPTHLMRPACMRIR
jgi:multicomponent Na+:H+ antiporter subunit E